ncbi:hypothetical protein EON65_39920 [archaeon]|nr:MAG: hypothetical protein EON65_39920 [archaeon]
MIIYRHNAVSPASDNCPSTKQHPGSKAFKADVRHTFSQLFEEGMNSADPTKLQQIMNAIMLVDCDMDVYRLDGHHKVGEEHHEASLLGRDHIIEHFIRLMLAIPDLVFLIHEWVIFPRAHHHSCLVFQFSLTGQQIFPLQSPCTAVDDENMRGYHRWLVHPPPPHYAEASGDSHSSVLFREGGAKYDSRRKNKFHTIGEYVDIHQLPSQAEGGAIGGESPCTSVPSDSSHSNYNAGPLVDEECVEEPAGSGYVQDIVLTMDARDGDGEGGWKSQNKFEHPVAAMIQDKHVSIRGMMRFHINPENSVYKIHCVHMHDMH